MTVVEVLLLIRSQHQELKERTRKALVRALIEKSDYETTKRLLRYWEQHLVIEDLLFKEYYYCLTHNEFMESSILKNGHEKNIG